MSLTHTANIPTLLLTPATPSPPPSPPPPAPSLSIVAPPLPRRIPRVPVPRLAAAADVVSTSTSPPVSLTQSEPLLEDLGVAQILEFYLVRRHPKAAAAAAAATSTLPFTNLTTVIDLDAASTSGRSHVKTVAVAMHTQELEKFRPPGGGIEERVQAWDALKRAKEAVGVSKVDERIDGALGRLGW
ncbi:hypothetical protein JCM5296_004679 [Sporobolomyces johnsonii]